MKRSAYRDRDYAFGQVILTLRTAIGLTQTGLADYLGVSRRAVGDWESGSSYPKANHLKQFIALAIQHHAFPAGREADEIRSLWKAAHQKVLLDEAWLATLLIVQPAAKIGGVAPTTTHSADKIDRARDDLNDVVNLPLQPTSFIGRVAELTEIIRILSDTSCRLLTLLGPGGVGKTRLAVEVAACQAETFDDGAAFAPLASVGTPNQIVSAIGDALHLSFAGQADPMAYLLGYLRERHLLLVLDNFEHLLDGAELVHDILQHTLSVTILVTSRSRLNLQAEWLFDVEGLTYPAATPSHSVADLADYSAVQLFVQRATQIQPGFSLSESALNSIVRICQHVAGMPLAIELAVAGVRTQSIDEIERQIHVSLGTLSTTLRDVPPRHRSMRAVFDHSWNLLNEPERALFSRLSVFRGGCTAEAAEQVAQATLPVLLTLVDMSLLRQIADQPKSNATTEPRFLLLEPIREYALEKLAGRGETEAIQRAHATYYLALAESAAAQWDSPTTDAAIVQLDYEYDNLRAALQWSRNGGDLTIGLQLGGALRKFWQSHGYISEGRGWLEELLALDDNSQDTTAITARLRALQGAAWLASDQQDFAQAARFYEQSMEFRRVLGETEGETEMNLLINDARQARAAGQYQRATILLEETLLQYRILGNRASMSSAGLGRSLFELALLRREQGDFGRATALYEECIALHRELGYREGMTAGLLGLGDIARDQGNVSQMREYCEETLAVFQELGAQWGIGFSLHNLALGAYLEGDFPQAHALVNESVSLFRSINDDGAIAEVLVTLGHILRAQGDVAAARAALTEALRHAQVVGPRLLVAAALEGLAGVMVESGQAPLAVQFLGAASALRTEMVTPVRPADQPAIEHTLATAQLSLGADTLAALWSQAEEQPLDQIISLFLDAAPSAVSLPQQPAPKKDDTPRSPDFAVGGPRVYWDDALSVPTFYGREWEQNLLRGWLVEERCRVVSVLGLGGIGKSALAVSLMHQVAEHFEVVIWRSMRDIPTCEMLLEDLVQVLAPQALREIPDNFERRLSHLLEHLRTIRLLLVLDNLESVLQEGEASGHMLPGYEGFGRFLRLSAETEHQSCVLLTSREKPKDLVPLEGSHAPVRALRLARLDAHACEALLTEKNIIGAPSERAQLIEVYDGNPLALKIVAQTIVDLFDGELGLFLEQGEIIFGGIRELLTEQFVRLSALEQSILLWLAIMREPATLDELLAVLVSPVPRARLLEAVEALRRRSLIERGQKQGSFTLQSVVLEYVTAKLIAEVSDELEQGQASYLIEYGFELAQIREYARQNQERLIVNPILANLRSAHPYPVELEVKLLALLDQLRTLSHSAQGYGPANLVTLLRLLRGNLRGLDLSRLALRSMYLQGVEMQDATLSEAFIQASVFTETFDDILAVAISTTGAYWAASTRRREIRVWDAGGLTLRHAWRAHDEMVWSLIFSPDERTLISGSWDGVIKLWEVASGSLLWSGRHPDHMAGMALTLDGSLLASVGPDATLRLWDAHSGVLLQILPHPHPLSSVAWNPNGALLASGDTEGSVYLWDVAGAAPAICVQTLTAHANLVDGLSFAPDGSTLASASWDGTVKLWAIPGGQLRETLTGHTEGVRRVAWSPDGRLLASCGFEKTIWLWDLEQGNYYAPLRGHAVEVTSIAFTPDGRGLLSGSEDGALRLWDVASGQCLRVMQGYTNSLYSVDWSPDGTQLVSGGTDRLVTIHSARGEVLPRVLGETSRVVVEVGWSGNGRWLASSEWGSSIQLWDPASGAFLQVLPHPDDPDNFFNGLAWSPDGQRLACGTSRSGVQVFEMMMQPRWVGKPFPIPIHSVGWSPDGVQAAGGGKDGTLYVWDADEGLLLRRLLGHHSTIIRVTWSPDGQFLASTSNGRESGELFVWDAVSGERIHTLVGHPSIINALVWGASGEILVSGGGDGTLRWWDVQSGACVLQVDTNHGKIMSLKTSPDGTMLASCGDDGAIMLWDLHTGEHLQTLRRDRPYERLNITGIRGLTEAQKATLRALGAIENDHV